MISVILSYLALICKEQLSEGVITMKRWHKSRVFWIPGEIIAWFNNTWTCVMSYELTSSLLKITFVIICKSFMRGDLC